MQLGAASLLPAAKPCGLTHSQENGADGGGRGGGDGGGRAAVSG